MNPGQLVARKYKKKNVNNAIGNLFKLHQDRNIVAMNVEKSMRKKREKKKEGRGMKEDTKVLRKQVLNLATALALQETERTGEDYTRAINKALDEACIRLGVNHKDFIKMFI
ncbi:hypothetical protein [Caloramator sp. Dgby_cultured_2]|uniref:hypothetical protein n=1 Tax=Caloramator sp. Dgby_cultured_2 TaxID=3029174 RepID=UPI00237EE916|nr:hypothetical protein [Caloramator sp. Dgby_cultured_2]WDU84227.1 hypothetical protein PWK10_07880 [Caloramator sp. Dgby_cultured_2]